MAAALDWAPLLQQVRTRLAESQGAVSQGEGCHPDSRRLFHGRGGCFAGFEHVCVDSFFPAMLVSLFGDRGDAEELCAHLWPLAEQRGYRGIAVQRRYLPRAPVDWLCGEPIATPVARRGALQFPLTFEQQNVGFFLDIEPGRRWLEQRVAERAGPGAELKLLNLFAFTCAFSAVARAAGELEVVNVDLKRGVLKRGRENHTFNKLPLKGIQFLPMDALREFNRFDRRGPFQLAVVDPPTWQRGSFDVNENYGQLLQLLPGCLADEADLLLVLNSPRHSEAFFRELIARADSRYQVIERLPQSPDFPDKDPDAALKMLHVRFSR